MSSNGGPRIKNAKKTVVDKITFASHMEARRYIELKKLKAAGVVTKIECQPEYELQPSYRKCCDVTYDAEMTPFLYKKGICECCGKKMPTVKAIRYVADFRITYADGHIEIEDVKGMETEIFKIKRKILEFRYPEITLKVIKKVRS
jgi:hypothetical protein